MSASAKPSERAKRFWQRLTEWYGTRLTEQYGVNVPSDWAALIDGHENDQVKIVLGQIRAKFLQWPPSLPEVDALFSKSSNKRATNLPTMQSMLCRFVLNHRRLTMAQCHMPWKYLYRGDSYSGAAFEISGIEVPADGDAPGYRVMVEDMTTYQAA